ncbi:MAG: hypothetical protein HYX68_02085 [Planctomycetes bacterium]|jgi:hypothetical protein|nr:hypothetical protein [Planctomycetota bacterium]
MTVDSPFRGGSYAGFYTSAPKMKKAANPNVCGFYFQLPRLDSNQDHESQNGITPRHNLRAKTTFGNDAIPFDAGLRKTPETESFNAEQQRVLDAWPTLTISRPDHTDADRGKKAQGIGQAIWATVASFFLTP